MILEFQQVTKKYTHGNTTKDALAGVNLALKENDFTLVLGPSGSGKSTLIHLASLITKPNNGEILYNNVKTSQLAPDDKSLLRRREISIIRQRDNLFPFLNLLENVLVPQWGGDNELAIKLLEKTGVTEFDACPRDKSLFVHQKVALARALVNNPSILLADEPTGELNQVEITEFMELFKKMTEKTAILMVSNNHALKKYADNVFQINDGSVEKVLKI